MSEFRLSFPAFLIAGKSRLTAEDVLTLRQITFPDGLQTSDDVITVLALQNSCPEKCVEWRDFFIEMLTDFVVHYSYPQGSLDDINAAWMARMLSRDGVVNSRLELDLILGVMKASANVPPELSAFVLDQLRIALRDGTGAYHASRPVPRRGITRYDLDFVLDVLQGAVDHGQMALAPAEIAVIDQIDRLTAPGANHPGWAELMKAIKPAMDGRRQVWRWLRIPDSMFADETRVA